MVDSVGFDDDVTALLGRLARHHGRTVRICLWSDRMRECRQNHATLGYRSIALRRRRMFVTVVATPVLSPSSLWNSIIESVAASLLVCYLASVNEGMAARVLKRPWLQRLGEASYSFYLLHPVCLLFFWRCMRWLNSAQRGSSFRRLGFGHDRYFQLYDRNSGLGDVALD